MYCKSEKEIRHHRDESGSHLAMNAVQLLRARSPRRRPNRATPIQVAAARRRERAAAMAGATMTTRAETRSAGR